MAAGARRAYQTTRTTNQSLLPRMRTLRPFLSNRDSCVELPAPARTVPVGLTPRPPTRTALLGTSVTTPTVRRCTARPPTSRHTSVGTRGNGHSSVWSAASGSRAATTSTTTSRLTRSCGRRRPAAYQTTNQSLLPRMRTPPVQLFSKVKISSKVSSNYHLISELSGSNLLRHTVAWWPITHQTYTLKFTASQLVYTPK